MNMLVMPLSVSATDLRPQPKQKAPPLLTEPFIFNIGPELDQGRRNVATPKSCSAFGAVVVTLIASVPSLPCGPNNWPENFADDAVMSELVKVPENAPDVPTVPVPVKVPTLTTAPATVRFRFRVMVTVLVVVPAVLPATPQAMLVVPVVAPIAVSEIIVVPDVS